MRLEVRRDDPFAQRRVKRVLEPAALGDPDEPLPAEAREREQVVEDVEHPRLVERPAVHEDRDAHAVDLCELGAGRDCRVEEGEEERVKDADVALERAPHPGLGGAPDRQVVRLERVERREHGVAQDHAGKLRVLCRRRGRSADASPERTRASTQDAPVNRHRLPNASNALSRSRGSLLPSLRATMPSRVLRPGASASTAHKS